MIEITPILPEQVAEVRLLIYTVAHGLLSTGRTLEADLVHFQENWVLADLDDVQASYMDNGGTFLVAVDGGRVIGSGGIRRVADEVCELKRFWFYPEFHGTGLSQRVISRLYEAARQKGYRKMRLVTTRKIQERAIAFYKKQGFYEIPNYDKDPDDISMEREL